MRFMLLHFDTGSYSVEGEEDASLGILLSFLNHDVGESGSWVPSFKKWALNAKEGEYTNSNVSFVRKKHDSIIVKDLFTMGEEDQPFCEIKLQSFLALLDKWAEAAKKKPLYLVLVDRGNGDVSLEETYAHRDLSKW